MSATTEQLETNMEELDLYGSAFGVIPEDFIPDPIRDSIPTEYRPFDYNVGDDGHESELESIAQQIFPLALVHNFGISPITNGDLDDNCYWKNSTENAWEYISEDQLIAYNCRDLSAADLSELLNDPYYERLRPGEDDPDPESPEGIQFYDDMERTFRTAKAKARADRCFRCPAQNECLLSGIRFTFIDLDDNIRSIIAAEQRYDQELIDADRLEKRRSISTLRNYATELAYEPAANPPGFWGGYDSGETNDIAARLLELISDFVSGIESLELRINPKSDQWQGMSPDEIDDTIQETSKIAVLLQRDPTEWLQKIGRFVEYRQEMSQYQAAQREERRLKREWAATEAEA